MFIIATSRNYTSLFDDINYYNIKYSYIICKDGGMIYDRNKNVIYKKDIDPEIARDIYEIISCDKSTTETWIDNGYDFTLDIHEGCNSLIGKVRNLKKCKDLLDSIKKKYSTVSGYISGCWLYIMDKTVNKARGIKYILRKHNLPEENVYTIGLDDSDLNMIEDYHGYAVEDSSDVVKQNAEEVCEDFSEAVNQIDNIK